MGAWGIKALERDEGLDVLDILKNEYVPEHPVMDLGEMIELMKEEVMLGSDFSQIEDVYKRQEMWDEKALLLVLKELTAIALQEQDEIAAYARMALSKIKDPSERLRCV